jgi:hypothetical protein
MPDEVNRARASLGLPPLERRSLPALTGYLCEVCLDSPAVTMSPAPWGGEMGVCQVCLNSEEARG